MGGPGIRLPPPPQWYRRRYSNPCLSEITITTKVELVSRQTNSPIVQLVYDDWTRQYRDKSVSLWNYQLVDGKYYRSIIGEKRWKVAITETVTFSETITVIDKCGNSYVDSQRTWSGVRVWTQWVRRFYRESGWRDGPDETRYPLTGLKETWPSYTEPKLGDEANPSNPWINKKVIKEISLNPNSYFFTVPMPTLPPPVVKVVEQQPPVVKELVPVSPENSNLDLGGTELRSEDSGAGASGAIPSSGETKPVLVASTVTQKFNQLNTSELAGQSVWSDSHSGEYLMNVDNYRAYVEQYVPVGNRSLVDFYIDKVISEGYNPLIRIRIAPSYGPNSSNIDGIER